MKTFCSICALIALFHAFNIVEALSPSKNTSIKSCYFGAGCFWEPADKLKDENGIVTALVGYCGDDDYFEKKKKTPSYDVICRGNTRFVEAVKVDYDMNALTYRQLLELFAKTNTAKAGNSRQYQGVIFVNDSEEEKVANEFLESNKNVVAYVEPMSKYFHSAEPYHQNYWAKFRTRLAVLIPSLLAINYSSFEDKTKIFNIVIYGFFAFVLLERKIDSRVETFQIGK